MIIASLLWNLFVRNRIVICWQSGKKRHVMFDGFSPLELREIGDLIHQIAAHEEPKEELK